jgi:DNA recombination protein RmuC
MSMSEIIRWFGPLALSFCLLLALLALWVTSRKRSRRDAREIQQLLAKERDQGEALTVAGARLEASNERVALLEAALENRRTQEQRLQTEARDLSTRLAAALEKNRAGEEQLQRLERKEMEIGLLGKQIGDQKATIAELETVNREEKKRAREQLDLLSDAGERLKREFENLANRIFEEKGRRMVEMGSAHLSTAIDPLRSQLGDFRKRVEDVYDREARDRVALLAEIDHLKNLNRRISEDAVNLTNALKADSKVQGNWGEMILERILEESGLTRGREYDLQVSLTDGRRRFQPDALVRLPGGRHVIIDAKVSLTAWERYCSAGGEEDRMTAIRAHVASLRAHIRSLGSKHYTGLAGVNSPDFVLLFVPVEGAFIGAVRAAEGLFAEAYGHDIVIVCPSTLLVTLRTIQNLWQGEYQNRNAVEIASRAGELYDKFVGFIEAMEEIGCQLDRAATAYHTARKRLCEGRGNLVNRAQALKELGVQSRKQLPSELVEMSDSRAGQPSAADADPTGQP